MELRHLRYFVAVAEELSFRRAADKLHIAQPPLSAQIKGLEEELRVRLFERTTRSVRLTHAGRVFLDEARTVLAASLHAEQRAREAQHGLAGTLRVGVIAPMANAWLAGILRRFRHAFPGVQLSLFDLTSTEQLRRLRDHELDAGLLRPPIAFPELDFRFTGESRQVLALPAGHPLAKKSPLEWQDFHDQELVLMTPNAQHGFYDAFLAACAKAGAKPRPVQYANDIQTKMWLISAGFGIAPTTASLSEVKRPGLVFRPLPPGLPPVQTVLAWRRDDHSPVLAHFRESFTAWKG
ncbi:MAG TPA: LysR substrate-binding domain-containing protein [Candidatus Sulfotelmatobacter sp.]|nr:LysR substrate-binding domain-containing protein [Candidatus Sulfotelmatobacter sp.]HWI57812.1 LysR substrate-binding domain-containing protein [Bacillota bacterium]